MRRRYELSPEGRWGHVTREGEIILPNYFPSPEDMDKFTTPKGPYAYPRIALILASSFLEQWIKAAQLKKKVIPDLVIEAPCPPLFNAHFIGRQTIDLSADSVDLALLPQLIQNLQEIGGYSLLIKNIAESANTADSLGPNWIADYDRQGRLIHGTIRTSDAIADTYLYLGRTRNYLIEALDSARARRPPRLHMSRSEVVSKKIPAEIIAEITSLFHAWDHWQFTDLNHRLDWTQSPDVPPIGTNAEPSDLANLILNTHLYLVVLLFMALAHEYGHLLQHHDQEVREKMRDAGHHLLDFLLAGYPSDFGFLPFGRYQDLLRSDQDVFKNWETELSCDALALESTLSAFSNLPIDKHGIVKILATMCLLFSIVEVYYIRKHSALGLSHPISFLRFYFHIIFIYRFLWNDQEDWPTVIDGIATIMALQSRLLSNNVMW